MAKELIIHSISTFFEGIDEHNWTKMRQPLADGVVLDSSGVGRSGRQLSGDQLVSMSRTATGGFQSTCHQFGNCRLQHTDLQGEARFDLLTLHYLPQQSGGDVWTLFRKMTMKLIRHDNGQWLITLMQTDTEKQAGNPDIPVLAQKGGSEDPTVVPGINEQVIQQFFVAMADRDEDRFQSLWSDEGQWKIFLSLVDEDQVITGKPSIIAHFKNLSGMSGLSGFRPLFKFPRKSIDTADPDITILPFETIIQLDDGTQSAVVSAAIFYCKNGLIRQVEEYRAS